MRCASTLLLLLALAPATARSNPACPDAPLAGPWNFEAGKMTADGKFTALGGGMVKAQLEVIDCGTRLVANIATVGIVEFKRVDGQSYSAEKPPAQFGPGIHWDLTVAKPTSLTSEVYFNEPKRHAQTHRWTYVGLPRSDVAPEPGAEVTELPDPEPGLMGHTPLEPTIKQGLWGAVPEDKAIVRYGEDPATGGTATCLPPAAHGFYQLPAEAGERVWLCVVDEPCTEDQAGRNCIELQVDEGLEYCSPSGTSWDC